VVQRASHADQWKRKRRRRRILLRGEMREWTRSKKTIARAEGMHQAWGRLRLDCLG
jgi:hypothetical protein